MAEAACVEARRSDGSWLSLRELVEVPSLEAGSDQGHFWLRARSRIVTWRKKTLTGDSGIRAETSEGGASAARLGSLTSVSRTDHWRLEGRGVRGLCEADDGRRGQDLVN